MVNKFSWTIFIVAQYDDKFKFEFCELWLGALNTFTNARIRYVFLKFKDGENFGEVTELFFEESETNPTKLQKVERKSTFEFTSGSIYDLRELTSFFKKFNGENEKSDRLMVMLWGHGVGLGFFVQKVASKVKSNYTNYREGVSFDVKSYTEQIAYLGANLSIPLDFGTDNFFDLFNGSREENSTLIKELKSSAIDFLLISAEHLSQIFLDGFEGQKVDHLICASCYMQMFETGFSLRNQVRLLTAPQTTFPFCGYNYPYLFEAMNKNPSLSLKSIAENLTSGFNLKYKDQAYLKKLFSANPDYRENFGDFSLIVFSSNMLSEYSDLLLILNKLAAQIKMSFNQNINNDLKYEGIVYCSRQFCLDVTPGVASNHAFIDITQFIEKLYENIKKYVPNSQLSTLGLGDLDDWLIDFQKHKNFAIVSLRKEVAFTIHFERKKFAIPQSMSIFFPHIQNYEIIRYLMSKFYFANSRTLNEFQRYAEWDDCMRFLYSNYIEQTKL